MKLYDKLDASLTYQSMGQSWFCILEGKTEDIEQAYSGIFNFCGVRGNRALLHYENESKTIGTFFSSENLMADYFRVRALMQNKSEPESIEYSRINMEELRNSVKTFRRFTKPNDYSIHALASASAEKPDESIQDALISHSFGLSQGNGAKATLDDDLPENETPFISVQKKPEIEESESEVSQMFNELQNP